MVVFRLLQGVFGAALVPLSQALMLDIYPPAAARLGDGDLGHGRDGGPDPGPDARRLSDRRLQLALGVLRQPAVRHRWRWPGSALFMPRTPTDPSLRFDWTGFGVLALGLGALQMMLDRGQDKDWFTSGEIIIEAVLAGLGLYLFVVHMLTAEKPFIPPRDLPRPQLLRIAADDVRGRHGAARELGAAGALAAEPRRLSGRDGGAGDGAARHRHHGGDDVRRPALRSGSIRAS